MLVDCPYEDKCLDYDKKCSTCENNKRRSYYKPVDYPYYPYYPCYPYYPTYPYYTITCTTAASK